MCIYCNTSKYRKIYQNHVGPIPLDKDGRSYDIHHLDGNRNNNHPNNLKAVTIQEHYDIHNTQGDWAACSALIKRMHLTPKELSERSSFFTRKRIEEGNHPFLGGEIQRKSNLNRVANGTNPFSQKDFQAKMAKKRIANGTHHFTDSEWQRENQLKRVREGNHHLQNGEIQRKASLKRIQDGTHNFITQHECPNCGKIGRGQSMKRWHFDKCRSITIQGQ